MCEPISIGIATAVVGAVGSIASYSQQGQAASAAYAAQAQQSVFSNQQVANQAIAQSRTNTYQTSLQNQQISSQNQIQLLNQLNQNQSVDYTNLRTNQEFLSQQLQRSTANLQQQLAYQTDLTRYQASQEALKTQLGFNNASYNRANLLEQQKVQDAAAKSAFEGQKLLATNLQAQGSVLASGRTGQSIGLLVNDADRAYGRDAAMLNQNMDASLSDYYQNSAFAYLQKLNQDADAYNKMMPEPIRPMDLPDVGKPVFASYGQASPLQSLIGDLPPTATPVFSGAGSYSGGPSALGLVAGIGGAVLGGVQAGYSAQKPKQSIININPAPAK
jgi:hypothetical protein